MSDLAAGLADSSNSPASPSVETPQTVDSVFDSAVTELSVDTPSEPQTPAVDGDVPTTEAPAPAPVQPEELGEPTGPIPFTVHKTALENARTKERESVLAQVQSELAPILPVMQAITRDVQTGSVEGLRQLLKEYGQNPATQAAFRAEMGRALSQMRGPKPAVEDVEPEADLQTADGALVYSAAQQAKREQWLTRQWDARMQKELQPLKQTHQDAQKAKESAQKLEAVKASAIEAYTEWAEQPHFKENVKAIQAEQHRLWETGMKPEKALRQAYLTVLNRDVIPKLQSNQHQSLVQQAAAKVRASTDNPAASAPAQPRRISAEGRSQRAVMDEIFDLSIAEQGGARAS
jgi:hypothetical protein